MRHDMTLAVKVALNLNTINHSINYYMNTVSMNMGDYIVFSLLVTATHRQISAEDNPLL